MDRYRQMIHYYIVVLYISAMTEFQSTQLLHKHTPVIINIVDVKGKHKNNVNTVE